MNLQTEACKPALVPMVALWLILAGCSQSATPITQVTSQPVATEVEGAESVEDFVSPAGTLGVVVDDQNRVLTIESGSAAEQAALQVGDLLESLNDLSFSDRAGVKAMIRGSEAGTLFALKLNRNGQALTLEITPVPRRPQLNAPTPTPVPPTQDYF